MHGRTVDIVVIGAGITGACVSHALTQAGRQVVVLDRRGPARGSTSASTALITFELDLPLHLLARMTGVERAVGAWRHSLGALARLRQLVEDERISCGWSDRASLYLAGTAHGYRALRTEVVMRQAHGIPGRYLTGGELRSRFGVERTGAIVCQGVAVADPVRLTAGILRAAQGVEIRSPVEVCAVHSERGVVELETSEGIVRTRTAVFCTGYELLDGLPTDELDVASTWAIATAPAAGYPEWLDSTIVWEASDPYLYLRTMPGGRLLVGGRDEGGADRHANSKLMPVKARRLAADARRLLGIRSLHVERCWSGAFGSSRTGLPVIGAVPGVPGCHVVAGFGGNGITHAMLAAEVLVAQVQGRRWPYLELYHPVARP